MQSNFKGKVVLVSGGGNGMGRATSVAFAKAGAQVVIGDLDAASSLEVVAEITGANGEAVFRKTDISNAADVAALVDTTIQQFGRLDCAANVAGVSLREDGLLNCSEEIWDRSIAVNLKGLFLCMKHQVPKMIANGGGAIVNVSSVGGLVGSSLQPAYVAAKHGVIGLTKSAALEFAASRVRINCICPGLTRSNMTLGFFGGPDKFEAIAAACTPLGRSAAPEEMAQAMLWLCSDSASFVTGHTMLVDGGMLAGTASSTKS